MTKWTKRKQNNMKIPHCLNITTKMKAPQPLQILNIRRQTLQENRETEKCRYCRRLSYFPDWRLEIKQRTTRVYAKSFSEAKDEDMSHYIKPSLNHAPDGMIIHIGTNNLRKDTPEEIYKKVENLCCMLQNECPYTKIPFSEITPRRDFKEASHQWELPNKGLYSHFVSSKT